MMPAVMINGTKLGINEITTIRGVLNSRAIKIDVTAMAKTKLCNKLFTRYLVVSSSKTAAPVTDTVYRSDGKISAVVALTRSNTPFSSCVGKSCDCTVMRNFWWVVSINERSKSDPMVVVPSGK